MKKLIPESIKRGLRIFFFRISLLKYGVDLSKLKFIGVTGTSGKTTTSFMIYHILNEANFNVGLISTNQVIAKDEILESGLHVTTPDSKDLILFLKKMIDKGIEYVVLESSSHALEQGRVGTIKYDFAVYTNIASDHMDYHKTWVNYARSKARMIDRLIDGGKIVINKDDAKSYEYLKNYPTNNQFTEYSLSEVSNLKQSLEGVRFIYNSQEFGVNILGEYNISNALAAIKVAELLGIDIKKIAQSFYSFKTIQGRMEIFQLEPFSVILDFAHNKDSLEKSLTTAKNLVKDNGNLISIFGSAGLRDIDKREQMGEISGQIADITIITAEDPRTEKLFNINTEILNGVEKNRSKFVKRFETHQKYLEYKIEMKKYNKNNIPESPYLENGEVPISVQEVFIFDEENINSRIDAIDFAMQIAKKGDVVIVNGKGHERSLAFGTIEYPFSDADSIQSALKVEQAIN